jgi:hypothetical protein
MKNTIPICLEIKFGHFQGNTMDLIIFQNNVVVFDRNGSHDNDTVRLEFHAVLPLDLRILVSGKEMNDTEVDAFGNIINDKCVIVNSMSVDKIWLKKWILESRIFRFRNANNGLTKITNYFGSNGEAFLHIPLNIMEFWIETVITDGGCNQC